jgi:hypothetical protein
MQKLLVSRAAKIPMVQRRSLYRKRNFAGTKIKMDFADIKRFN